MVALSVILTVVRGISIRIPVLCIHGAFLAVGDIVCVQDVGIVELAQTRSLSGLRMLDVVLGGSIVNGGASFWVEGSIVCQQAHTQVCVIVIPLKRSIDRFAGQRIKGR